MSHRNEKSVSKDICPGHCLIHSIQVHRSNSKIIISQINSQDQRVLHHLTKPASPLRRWSPTVRREAEANGRGRRLYAKPLWSQVHEQDSQCGIPQGEVGQADQIKERATRKITGKGRRNLLRRTQAINIAT